MEDKTKDDQGGGSCDLNGALTNQSTPRHDNPEGREKREELQQQFVVINHEITAIFHLPRHAETLRIPWELFAFAERTNSCHFPQIGRLGHTLLSGIPATCLLARPTPGLVRAAAGWPLWYSSNDTCNDHC